MVRLASNEEKKRPAAKKRGHKKTAKKGGEIKGAMPVERNKKKKGFSRKMPRVAEKDMKKKGFDYTIPLVIAGIVILALALINIGSILNLKEKAKPDVVLSVNGQDLSYGEFSRKMNYYKAQLGTNVSADFVINQSISEMLLVQEAEKQGIKVNDSLVDKAVDSWLEQLRQKLPQQEIEKMLNQQGMTLDEFKDDMRKNYRNKWLVFELLNRTVFPKLNKSEFAPKNITEKDVIEEYNKNKDSYYRLELRHILICYNGTIACSSNRSKEEARELAESIEQKAKQGYNFSELAEEYSDGPSKSSGGYLGFIGRGDTVEQFENAAFSLTKPGQISGVVETPYGFHIIKLVSIKSGLDDFRKEIEINLRIKASYEAQQKMNEATQKLIKEYLDKLRAKADIKVYGYHPVTDDRKSTDPRIKTFSVRDNAICKENGKPVIRLYTTTWCPHCKWISDAFDRVVKEYVSDGKIVAHHWLIDTGDDSLTEFKETFVPEDELKVYQEFNPRGSIPTFVFGCKYYRIGNGYEAEDDLNAEESEFRAIIDKLVAES